MKKYNALLSWMSFVTISALTLAFVACNPNNSTPATEAGVHITSVTSQGNSSLSVGGWGYSGLPVSVSINDGGGTETFNVQVNGNTPIYDMQQINNMVYQLQAQCDSQTCTGIGFLISAYPISTLNGGSNGFGNNGFNSLNTQFGVETYSSTITGIVPLYTRAFLFRMNVNNQYSLVNEVNGTFSTLSTVPGLEN